MNQDQFLSWLRTTLSGVGYLATSYGITSGSTAATVSGIIMAAAPYVWGFFVHTDAAKLQAAGAVPGVRPVEVTSSAAPDLQRLAIDDTIPSVVLAAPTYVPPTASMRR